MGVEERVWAKVEKTPGCWLWRGARNGHGYGLARKDGRWQRAHRVVYELVVGPIPIGMNLMHTCDNPPCVNPAHLRPATQRENLEDMTRKGRRRNGIREQRGMRNAAAKLTDEQVAHIKGMALAGYYQDDIATQFGITRANVSYITWKTWTHVAPVPYPPAVRDRPLGRSAPRRKAARAAPPG